MAIYKVLRRLKHNGKKYAPHVDAKAIRRKAGPEGIEKTTISPAGWPDEPNAPTTIDEKVMEPEDILALVKAKQIERIEDKKTEKTA